MVTSVRSRLRVRPSQQAAPHRLVVRGRDRPQAGVARLLQRPGAPSVRAPVLRDPSLTGHEQYEREPEQDEPFDFNARPSRFYFDVESVGSLKPDDIVRQGIESLVVSLNNIATELHVLTNGPAEGAMPEGEFGGQYDYGAQFGAAPAAGQFQQQYGAASPRYGMPNGNRFDDEPNW